MKIGGSQKLIRNEKSQIRNYKNSKRLRKSDKPENWPEKRGGWVVQAYRLQDKKVGWGTKANCSAIQNFQNIEIQNKEIQNTIKIQFFSEK